MQCLCCVVYMFCNHFHNFSLLAFIGFILMRRFISGFICSTTSQSSSLNRYVILTSYTRIGCVSAWWACTYSTHSSALLHAFMLFRPFWGCDIVFPSHSAVAITHTHNWDFPPHFSLSEPIATDTASSLLSSRDHDYRSSLLLTSRRGFAQLYLLES